MEFTQDAKPNNVLEFDGLQIYRQITKLCESYQLDINQFFTVKETVDEDDIVRQEIKITTAPFTIKIGIVDGKLATLSIFSSEMNYNSQMHLNSVVTVNFILYKLLNPYFQSLNVFNDIAIQCNDKNIFAAKSVTATANIPISVSAM